MKTIVLAPRALAIPMQLGNDCGLEITYYFQDAQHSCETLTVKVKSSGEECHIRMTNIEEAGGAVYYSSENASEQGGIITLSERQWDCVTGSVKLTAPQWESLVDILSTIRRNGGHPKAT